MPSSPAPDSLTLLASDWYWEQDADYRYVQILVPDHTPRWKKGAHTGLRRWELPGARALNTTWEQHRADLDARRPFHDLQYVLASAYDGQPRYMTCSGVPCFDPQGRFTGYRGTSRDITAQWLAYEERARLEATTRELQVLTYAIAHDVRAPLAAIHGFGEALEELDGAALSPKGRRYLQKIRAAARKMDAMTAGILQLAQISREPPARQPVDLSAVAADAWRTIAAQDPQRWVQVRIEPGLQACGDAVLLALVLQNLLANAWKFTTTIDPARVEVVGAAGAVSGEAVFCVRDNGVGFDPGYGDRLFTPFQRLHSADEFPGTGLGLAIVHKVIQVHGGRVWAESQPGKGAAFFFALPARC